MNDDDKKLIDRATAVISPATPGPWQWWTSCSYRRLSSVPSGADGDVLHGVVQRHDNHPDVHCSEADRAFIAESRMLVPGLVDLALRESSRADAAEQKLVQAKDQIERLITPTIKSIDISPGGMNCVFDGAEMARIIAGSFWDLLTKNQADNYVEMTFASPDKPLKKVVVTVRKAWGQTPDEMRRRAEQERDEALAVCDGLLVKVEALKKEVFDAGARIIRVRFEANDQHARANTAEAALAAATKRIAELEAALEAASPRPHSS